MATTSTTFTPGATLVPYIGPIPTQLLWDTIIPRAEILFTEKAGAVIAAAAGDDQRFLFDCIMPTGFAYAFQDFSMGIIGAEAGDIDDWEDNANLTLRDSSLSAADSTWIYQLGAEKAPAAAAISPTLDRGVYRSFAPYLKKLIIPRPSGGILQFLAYNLTIDGGPITIEGFARFLQYDLNQAYRAIVNTPVPVR